MNGSFDAELSQVVQEGLEFINNFYLEWDSKRVAQPSVLNLLMLNQDNFLDVNDDNRIQELTEAVAKEMVNREMFVSIVPENIRMLAVELTFV